MLPIVNRLGISDRLLCRRSLRGLGRFLLGLRFPRRSAICFDNHANGTRSTPDPVSYGHRDFGSCRKQYIHTGPETYQSHEISFFHPVPDTLPAHNPAGDDAGNLYEYDLDSAVADHDRIPFIFDARRVVVCRLELPFPVVQGLDTSRNRTAIDENIEERKKDTDFRHVPHAVDLHNLPVGRRYDNRRILWNGSRWITEKECHEG